MHNYTRKGICCLLLKKMQAPLLMLVLLLVTGMQSFAQVPPNDEPCTAITLIPAAACSFQTFSNVDASNSTAPGIPLPSCGAFVDADVWFKATVPPMATSITIATLSGPGAAPPQIALTDGAMSAYTATGTCPSSLVLTEVGCNDNFGVSQMPQLTVTAPAGTVIYIRMWGFIGETGRFGICVTANIPPANDECATAQSLTVNPNLLCGTVTAGTTTNATTSSTAPALSCAVAGANNDDVWYTFVATSVSHRVSLLNVTGTSTAMVIGVYSGACTALSQVGCIAGNTLDVAGLTVGATYRVRVYTNVTTAATANFNICVGTTPPPPPNDECTAAIALTVNPDFNCTVVTAGTTASATTSSNLPAPTCNPTGANDDVWFSFVATGAAHRISLTNIVTAGTAMSFNIYSGNCTSLVHVNCNTTNLINLVGLTPGATYYVRVYTTTAVVGTNASFNICVGTPPPPPVNDECGNAVNLTVNANLSCGTVTAGTTVSATATTGFTAPSCGILNASDDDVWFKFTATGTTHRISLLNVTGGPTAMVMVVYEGFCGFANEIGCSTTSLIQLSTLTPGNTYYVRVFTNDATIGNNSNFNICVGTPPPPPANNECAGAITAAVNPDYLCGTVTAGNTASATPSTTAPTPTCSAAGIDDDVWFQFVATNTTHRISLLNITGGNAMASVVYSGTCTALTQINCSTVNLYGVAGLTIGQTYYVRVYTTANSPIVESSFNLCIGTPPPPPANDECAGAVNLAVNPDLNCAAVTAGSTQGATQSTTLTNPTCGAVNGWNDDVWFKFTATATNNYLSLLNISPANSMTMVVYSGTCAALTQVGCANANTLGFNSLIPGNVYYVRVYTNVATLITDATFNICVGTPAPLPTCSGNVPAGLSCTTATPVCNFNGYCGNTTPHTPTTWPELSTAFCGSIENNSFVTFVASATTAIFNVYVTSSTMNLGIQMFFYQGGCGSGAVNSFGCYFQIMPTPIGGAPTLITGTGLTIGQTYYLMFDGFAGDVCDFVISTVSGVSVLAITPSAASICLGSSVTLTASGGNGTYTWSPATGLNTTSGATVIATPLVTTTYTVSSISAANCPVTKSVTVTVNPTATLTLTSAASTANQSVCTNNPISNITYAAGSGATGATVTGLPAGVTGIFSGGIFTISGTPSLNGIYNFIVTTTGPCAPVTANGSITVGSTLAAPVVTSPITYCQGSTAVPLTAIGINLLYYNVPTGGTGVPSIIPSTAVIGSTIYYVSQNSGTCESPRSAITVNVNATPLAPTVTSPVNYCLNATATPLAATGTNLLWYITATGGTGSTTAPTPLTTTVGTTNYYVSQTTGTCEGPRANIVVNVGALPASPSVTSPVIYCLNATAVPLTAGGTNLLWYTNSTGGTGSTTAPTPLTTTIGSTNYYVSQSNNGCESPRATITVTVNATTPSPSVMTPVVYCQGAVASQLTATGSNLLWYLTSTGGVGTTTAPTPITSTVGNTTYYVTQNAGNCESPRASITVTVNATPLAPIVTSPVNYCLNATATPLTATGTNLLWYTTATGGTGSTTAPTPITTAVGTINYYVSQTTGVCEGPRAVIVVNVGALPATPTVTTPVNYCQGATALQLTAGGTNLLWYTAATGGTGATTAPTPSTATVGSIIYYVSQSSNGCESPRAAITVTVNAVPAAPAVTTPVTYCQGATAVQLTATGTNLLWYTTATGGTGVSTAPTPLTTTVGSTTYYVSQTNANNCEGPRAAIVVNVTSTPAAPIVTTPVTYCQGATAIPLTATGTGLLWYTTATGGTGSTTAPTPPTTTVGSTNYYVSQTTGTCEGPRALITVTINITPAAPITAAIAYCQGATAVPLTATGTNLLWYTTATGGTGTATAPTPTTTTVGTQTYYVSQTTGACEGPRALITVTVNARPGAPTAVTPLTYCQNGTAAALTATGTNLLYYTSATGGTGSATLTPSTASAGSTVYYVSQSTGACEGPRAAITVNVNAALFANAGNAVTIARGDQVQLNGTGSVGARYLWTSNITPLALVNAAVSATTLTPIANPLQTTTYTLTVSDPNTPAVCPSASSSVVITVVSTCINVKNAFTPNGDGINDNWVVYEQSFCLKPGGVKVNVFNRYGSKVYESQNYNNTWDGTYKNKPVPDGTYYAVVEFTLLSGIKQIVKTDVTVLR